MSTQSSRVMIYVTEKSRGGSQPLRLHRLATIYICRREEGNPLTGPGAATFDKVCKPKSANSQHRDHRQFEQIPFSEPWKRGGSSSPRRWRSRRLHGRDWEGVDTPPGRGVLFANISPRPPRMSRPPARPTRLPLSSVVSAMNIRTPSMSQPSGSCARALGRASSLQNHGT